MSDPSRPRIRFQVQPTVSHYREPLIRRLQASRRLNLDLLGRFVNAESSEADRIKSASAEVLKTIGPVHLRTWGKLWWEKGQVAAVWRGGYHAFVLEGRIYTASTWVAAAAGRLRGRRVYLWGHGWKRPEDGIKRQFRLAFYSLVDGLLVYGDRAKDLGVSYGVPREKIKVVYNSLYSAQQVEDSAAEVPPQAHDDVPTIIYSSRLTTRHRLDTLAEALQDWDETAGPCPRVIIVGDGVERPRLERVFAEAGVPAQFLGAVYDVETLRELYAQADCAVSIGGAGLNVIQALSFGVPVVAEADNPDSSPEIEAVTEGETGRFYPRGDAAALRAVLQRVLGDREELERMASRGREVILARYTADRHAAAIEAALLELLER
ncbi:glycosyltransferase family 4 protein [Nesterenkonia flava]|uniref:Glycosyltransferase family 4 protein n=1 Tax=Nesterenkonia flava TaxID=469799 RepID=A0ABU1FRP8_9MICC|nr:glycosyltransferase family 4 protein [Nesterenkonia flava]MDR5711335.1 glycosyltransferase family 4 protein [Nesterenkonia flava]